MQILAARGHHALKMSTLCKDLGVTTGSFYNYFGNWANFIPALLGYWEQERTRRVLEITSQFPDPADRIHELKDLMLQFPHDSEGAIRAWSNGDPVVAEFQRRVDQVRIEALRALISDLIDDTARVELLSNMGMAMMIGMQSWRSPVDTGELRRLFDEYEAIIRSYADHPVH